MGNVVPIFFGQHQIKYQPRRTLSLRVFESFKIFLSNNPILNVEVKNKPSHGRSMLNSIIYKNTKKATHTRTFKPGKDRSMRTQNVGQL